MKNTVIIKGNKYGISIVLNNDVDFETLLKDLSTKLTDAENFFDSRKQLAVAFEGRTLSNDELDRILDVIQSNSKLNIQYVLDENSDLEATFFDILQTVESEQTPTEQTSTPQKDENSTNDIITEITTSKADIHPIIETDIKHFHKQESSGLFYKGTLRSGQSIESKDSLVIIGDVNPGASVTAGGNIVVIGSLKGSVTAGANGNKHAFVMALSMTPIQIQIADIIARSADTKKFTKPKKEDAMIATIVNDQICIELVSKAAIQDINIY